MRHWIHDAADRGVSQQLQRVRLGLRAPFHIDRRRAVGTDVEEHRQQVGARDAVHHGVMRLGDQRPAIALEPLHHPELPQRPCPVKVLGQDAAGQVAQLVIASRRGNSGAPDVVEDRKVRVVDPDRTPELEGDLTHFLAVARHQRQLARHLAHKVTVCRRRALEYDHAPDMHRDVGVFDVDE